VVVGSGFAGLGGAFHCGQWGELFLEESEVVRGEVEEVIPIRAVY
jgi:thioredoxin reductase